MNTLEKLIEEVEDWNAECGLFDDTPMSDYMEKKRAKEYREGLTTIITRAYEQGKAEQREEVLGIIGEELQDVENSSATDVLDALTQRISALGITLEGNETGV